MLKYADVINAFLVSIKWTEKSNISIEDVLLLKRLQEKLHLLFFNKLYFLRNKLLFKSTVLFARTIKVVLYLPTQIH